jgi:hypothetical protein
MMEGPGANSEEKHEPASDIDIAAVSSLKALDPKWPIREANIAKFACDARLGKSSDIHETLGRTKFLTAAGGL